MGEVWKARDTRLERTVAVKVLSLRLSANEEMRQRFEREAKTISQLSHPHICALYDVGREGETDFLVMEFLEGETLSDRLAKGALPLEQMLRFGIEIADALDKAHRQGVVHRDLKPGNVMITKSGVKLLDFGLAKAMAPATTLNNLTALPTQQALTQEGTILGTFQYMAPEQLEGKEADVRTDIFAFGAVLYEMATGKKAFSGTSQASLITAIMSSEPAPISTIQRMTPPALDRVVKTCLAKDPEDRWQSAHDVAGELKWIAEGSAAGFAVPAAVSSHRRRREILAWGVAAIAFLAAVGSILFFRRGAPVAEPVLFPLSPPPGLRFFNAVALSPDGRRVAFVAIDPGRRRSLWVRALDSLEVRRLDGTGGANQPFWSPDGRSIAFFQDNRLRRIDAEGRTIQTICESGSGFGGSWSPDGQIVFASDFGKGLSSVSASGGTASPATELDTARGDATHFFPSFLPDGHHFVFVARNVDPEKTAVMLGDFDSRQTRPLLRADSAAVWATPGWLLFAREGSLFAQRIDPRRFAPEGEPVSIARGVRFFTDTSGAVLSSGKNALVYGLWPHERKLVWVDRRGRELGTLGAVADYDDVAISPDGRRVAAAIRDPARGQNLDVWVLDVERGTASRVTTERTDEFHPVWLPDGEQLIYMSDHAGFYDFYQRPANGGPEQVVLRTKWDKHGSDVSRDGRYLLLSGSPDGHAEDLWAMALSGPPEPKPLVRTVEFTELAAQLSPDGRWIAFSSDESGRSEIYLQPFPSGAKRLVSDGGGETPVWRRDGRELFYVAADGKLTVVAMTARGLGIEISVPQPLFELRPAGTSSYVPRQYDVAPDGERLLVVRRVGEDSSDPVVVDLNWTARLSGR